jgi:hypothetical protein
MNNQELIRGFESNTLTTEFHHVDHVQLAFAYLSMYAPLDALERFCVALKRYAAAHRSPQLYHETITHAYFFLIRERMARNAGQSWEDFSRNNPDLFLSKNGILSRYYTAEALQSDLARSVFLFPDRHQ